MDTQDPTYLYLTTCSDVHTYDVIKIHMYTPSYTQVSKYIPGTENTPKPMLDARHHCQGDEEKYGLV